MPEVSVPNLILPGLGMGGYRSLRDLQQLGPLRKVTLVAGQNNAGKSNILRFASLLLPQPVPRFEWVDEPKPEGPPLRLQIAHYPLDEAALQRRFPQLADPQSLINVLNDEIFHPVEGGHIWLTYSCDGKGNGQGVRSSSRNWELNEDFLGGVAECLDANGQQVFNRASSELTSTGGGHRTDDYRRVFDKLFPFAPPPVAIVGAFRQIADDTVGDSVLDDANRSPSIHDYSGRNLVKRLALLASPPAEQYAKDRPRFEAINHFAQTVLEDNDVQISISAEQDELQVRHRGEVMPLSSLGTGIHQVIILAAAATLLERTLVCIEEPEVHLHPLLQRKLIRYLSEQTTNQYLIATHSAHMLDYERAAIVHVKHDATEGTVVNPATTIQSVSDVSRDLGYRPSDLIQANAVIWVEGPSDRIYLNRWLEMVAPGEFVEGIHYSIMFYGGALLRHLTAEDGPSLDEFISLRRLNRHSAILIDSDKSSPRSRLTATKVRVCKEFGREELPGFAWIGDCRTIENYVPSGVLAAAVSRAHPRSRYDPPKDKWDDPLRVFSKTTADIKRIPADKVRIARIACMLWPDNELSVALRKRLKQVVTFIRDANGAREPLPTTSGRPPRASRT